MQTTYSTGNSKSRRAAQADAEGRTTWTNLAKADRHGLTKAEAVTLQLNLGEWHHTSAVGNRTEYFDARVIAEVLDGIDNATAKAAATAKHSFADWREASAEAKTAAKLIESRVDEIAEREDWTL